MLEALEQGSSALSLTLGNKSSVFTWIKIPFETGWHKVFCKIITDLFLLCFWEADSVGFDLSGSKQGSVGCALSYRLCFL